MLVQKEKIQRQDTQLEEKENNLRMSEDQTTKLEDNIKHMETECVKLRQQVDLRNIIFVPFVKYPHIITIMI